jgi:peptidase E
MHPFSKATFVAIGGGDLLGDYTTAPIDKAIVLLTKKEHPTVLFIPYAALDVKSYVDCFTKIYVGLGAKVESLLLKNQIYTPQELQGYISRADIIYVGGGDYPHVSEEFKKIGLDTLIAQEIKKRPLVLTGLSAGAACWFKRSFGNNDTMEDDATPLNMCDELGFLPYVCNPHSEMKERQNFVASLSQEKYPGISIEGDAAVVFSNKDMYCLRTSSASHAYIIKKKHHVWLKEEIA